jgi:hypothetical protein
MAYPLGWMIAVSLRTPEGLEPSLLWRSVELRPVRPLLHQQPGRGRYCRRGEYPLLCHGGLRVRALPNPRRKAALLLVLSTIMLPKQVILVPLYIEMQRMGLIDSYWALTLPFLVDPFNIFLIRQYLLSIPTDCEEAARIDGAGELSILFASCFRC